MLTLERQAAITGVGQSQVGRRLGRSGLDLTIDATLAAVADAGLKLEDIDGVACWPGQTSVPAGMSPTHIYELRDALGLNLNWYCGGPEGPAQMSSVLNACMAVATGQARHVICFRTLTESTTAAAAGGGASRQGAVGQRVEGMFQWQVPMNAFSASIWVALFAQRHFEQYGTRREQLAQIALNARRNAGLNPKAVYRTPLSMDDYMASRIISSPLCLYDCDVPVDGSTVIIVSHIDAAKDLPCTPIRIEAISGVLQGATGWDQFEDFTHMSFQACADRLWSRTDYKAKDVDVAQLYDGFSYLTLAWLEALGFCGRGEGGDFVEGGKRIALEGELPLNTHGGQLSAGRLHGLGHLHEAVVQLRGQGEARQVQGKPRVAIVSNGGGPLNCAALLVRD